MTPPPSPPNRRRRRIVVVCTIAVLVLGLVSWCWPRVDQRLIGKWRLIDGSIFVEFRPDGTAGEFLIGESQERKSLRWAALDKYKFVMSRYPSNQLVILSRIQDFIACMRGRGMPWSRIYLIEELTSDRLTYSIMPHSSPSSFERMPE